MRSELKRLQRQLGVTFVHVTHAQDEALALADLVVVMQNGRIAQQGSPREVYGQAHTPFVASFIGDHSVLRGLVIGHDGTTLELAGPEGQRYTVPGTARLGAEVSFTVRADHARLTTSSAAGPNVLSGIAAAVEYLGHIVRVRLETSTGLELLVYQPEADFAAAPVDLGQVTQACWSTEDAVLLADAG
jgi:putative spermidine/putrescine transport system ATP-binding protein